MSKNLSVNRKTPESNSIVMCIELNFVLLPLNHPDDRHTAHIQTNLRILQ